MLSTEQSTVPETLRAVVSLIGPAVRAVPLRQHLKIWLAQRIMWGGNPHVFSEEKSGYLHAAVCLTIPHNMFCK